MAMDKYFQIKNKILESAESDDDIKAIVAIGSTTRSDVKADEYSDLDLFIVTSNTEPWFFGEYPKRFGNVNISFIENTLGGGKERRCNGNKWTCVTPGSSSGGGPLVTDDTGDFYLDNGNLNRIGVRRVTCCPEKAALADITPIF